ncbi:hypothetical protein MNBD_ALPHA01-271 [hydrothermal vent metagenome]|uniref:Cytoskeleton protein RodZ-like C-terminal domain-containing protein n=1 Tax=hydrothermal vent metagenome TaxID=652676 RepID=A0A3B0SR46_9ZZZZ
MENDIDCGASGENTDAAVKTITVGQKLFQARHNQTETDLEKISGELCIRPHLLAALEQDDFNKFASACYATGFLKNYAAYLGLNVSEIVSQYKKEFQGCSRKVDLVFLEVDKKHNYAQHMTISLIILSLLVLYGVWHSSSNSNILSLSALPDVTDVTSNILLTSGEVDRKKPADVELASAPAPISTPELSPEKSGFHLVQQAHATSPAEQGKTTAVVADQVRLSVGEDTWVRIVSGDDEILVDRVLLAGEEFYMTDRAGLKLMTSNAGAVSIHVGNIAVGPLGEFGETRDNIRLDKQDLLMKTARLTS